MNKKEVEDLHGKLIQQWLDGRQWRWSACYFKAEDGTYWSQSSWAVFRGGWQGFQQVDKLPKHRNLKRHKNLGRNAVCISCKEVIHLDPKVNPAVCPSCGITLDSKSAAENYEFLKHEEKYKSKERKRNLSDLKKQEYRNRSYEQTSLQIHACCIPLIAGLFVMYSLTHVQPSPYDNLVIGAVGGVIAVAGALALAVEVGWIIGSIIGLIRGSLDGLPMRVTRSVINDDSARQLASSDSAPKKKYPYKNLQICFVVLGLLVIAGVAAVESTRDAVMPPSEQVSATGDNASSSTTGTYSYNNSGRDPVYGRSSEIGNSQRQAQRPPNRPVTTQPVKIICTNCKNVFLSTELVETSQQEEDGSNYLHFICPDCGYDSRFVEEEYYLNHTGEFD